MHRSVKQGDGVAMWIVDNNNINWIIKKTYNNHKLNLCKEKN
jgi:hypothetical protein